MNSTAYSTNPSTPAVGQIMGSLLTADLRTQLRRRQSGVLSILVPVILLIAYQKGVKLVGAAGIIAIAQVVGLMSVGILGYALGLAQDREKGIFQRLRVTPAPTWAIMVSRLLVQLLIMLVMTIIVLTVARWLYPISLGLGVAVATIGVSLVAGAVYLALGQAVVGFVRTADNVNAAVRVLLALLAVGGIIGTVISHLSQFWKNVVAWSPFGTVQQLLAAALTGTAWTGHDWALLAANLGYVIVFAGLGIRFFSWTSE